MDPRWLEILKASGWQLLAISLALCLFWLLLFWEVLPKIDSLWVIYGLPLAILVTGSLTFVSLVEWIAKKVGSVFEARAKEKRKEEAQNAEFQRFFDYVEHLTETEFRILAYLFQNNQRTFVASIDGDLASTLYNQGFVELAARRGQQVSIMTATFRVPDAVWQVMQLRAEEFLKPKIELGYRNKRPWHSGF